MSADFLGRVPSPAKRPAAGAYTFSVEAKSGSAKIVANTLSVGVVSSVTPSADGATLYVNGLGSLPMAQVKQIF